MDTDARDLLDRLTGQSEIARELSLLDSQLREQIGVSEAVIITVDLIVAVTRLLIDDSDPRHWHERLGDLDEVLTGAVPHAQEFARALDALATDPTSVALRMRQPNFVRFLRRFLGAAAFDRLSAAVKGDGAALAIGVRRGTRSLMPLALALDDCVALVKPGQLATIEGWSAFETSLLKAAVATDYAIDQVINLGLPLDELTVREDELIPMTADLADGVEAIADQLHEVLEGRSSEMLLDLSHRLSRKVQGARDVLDTSADGVSQAANSLVEFIDRLLRTSFSEQEVLRWVRENRRDTSNDLVYVDATSGRERPTKRAQALAFVYAGQGYDEPSVFAELAALGVVASRAELQKLKHSDDGTDAERERMRVALASVEGFVVFAVRVCWASTPGAALDQIRGRLGD